MKVVLDTNVVVSGLIQSKGNPARILSLALAGAVEVCHDDRILAEYAEVLARPRGLTSIPDVSAKFWLSSRRMVYESTYRKSGK